LRTKALTSIRWKMIYYFVLSLALAALITLAIIYLFYNLAVANRSGFLWMLLYIIREQFGVVVPAVMTGFVLFIVIFLLISRNSLSYLEEISRALQEISLGNMDQPITERGSDELGVLAKNINQMSARLKESLEEERAAERAKNDLITSVSHDLRTPLTSILGYLELIESDRYRDEVELRQWISIAYEKTVRLKSLIDDLFEYTRVSHRGFRLKQEDIDLKELLEQLTEEFVPQLQEAGVKCSLTAREAEYQAMLDPQLIVRVFENLIDNAIRYGQEGKRVEIELSREGRNLVVLISNWGSTIPSADLPNIFDRFYRVERSRSAQTGGTGLGLAIAKNIVELHEGEISAFSHQDCTTFRVKLPGI